MTALDSDKWRTLRDAYGTADDIPELLQAVYSNPYSANDLDSEDVWFRLWSALCHQGDIYSGSIAAVPHLISAGLSATEGIPAFDLIQLPVSIEESRIERPQQVRPEDIDDDYWSSILNLATVCEIASKHEQDSSLVDSIRAATKLLRGRHGRHLPEQSVGGDIGDLFRTKTTGQSTTLDTNA